jgi:protein-S-isoprenylcysteine O-methyltransferase Ste14
MIAKLGNRLFHYRNFLFPFFYAALFIPSSTIFGDYKLSLVLGLLVIALGIGIRCITIGLVYIIRGGAKRQIHAETLVSEGIYKVCRNPMYLGNILLLLGFALFADNLLFLLVFFPIFIFFYVAIIRAEEDFLLGKFGEEYLRYKNTSNSLIPDMRKLSSAFTNRTFNWRKVVFKEYNSLFLYLSGINLILLYRDLIGLKLFIICETALLLALVIVKQLKINYRLQNKQNP